MKRSFVFILALLALILSACGSSSPNTNPTNPTDQGIGATSPANVGAAPTTDASGASAAPTTDASGASAAPTTDASGASAAPTTDASGANAAPTTDASGASAAPTTDASGASAAPTTMSATSMVPAPTTDASNTTGGSAQPTTVAGNIESVIKSDPRFSMLAQALGSSQLAQTLSASGPYTIFAPTNDAFATLPAGELDKLMADPTQLSQLLSYHVVSGDIKASDIGTMTSLPTLSGKTIQVAKNGGDVTLNGSTHLVMSDIETTNGVIHIIDHVLTPTS